MLAIRKITYADGWNCGPVIEIGEGEDKDYIDGAQTDLAIETLERIKNLDQPFYMALGYYRPHLPFAAPKKYWDLYNRDDIPKPPSPRPPKNSPDFAMNSMYELRAYAGTDKKPHPIDGTIGEDTTLLLKHGYLASVSYVDACIGKLFDAMKEMELYDNTVIMIWGDHGWKLGDHGSWGKMTNYEIDTHVPLIVKPELRTQSAELRSTDAIVELVDIFPSLCDLAGIPVEDYLQGQSFVPLLEDPEQEWKKAAFSQFHRRPKVAHDGGRYMGYSVQTKDFHYIEWHTWDNARKVAGDSVTAELYDHRVDMHESLNRIDDVGYANDLRILKEYLKQNWDL